jgi:hypothetical protein
MPKLNIGEFAVGKRLHAAVIAGDTPKIRIVRHHCFTVARQAHIQLNPVDPEFDGGLKGLY